MLTFYLTGPLGKVASSASLEAVSCGFLYDGGPTDLARPPQDQLGWPTAGRRPTSVVVTSMFIEPLEEM